MKVTATVDLRGQQLLERGRKRVAAFLAANPALPPMDVVEAAPDRWPFPVCAYYRPSRATVCVRKCAKPGNAGRQWSWPAYSTDRTPYGALLHELGHHVDYHTGSVKGRYWSDYGAAVRLASGEAPLTSYCENDAEWFAEVFRLFASNAALLSLLRPRAWAVLTRSFTPVSDPSWVVELRDAPQRYFDAVARKTGS